VGRKTVIAIGFRKFLPCERKDDNILEIWYEIMSVASSKTSGHFSPWFPFLGQLLGTVVLTHCINRLEWKGLQSKEHGGKVF
jgi:hypothetical protein